MTKKAIKELISTGGAVDITALNCKVVYEIQKNELGFSRVATANNRQGLIIAVLVKGEKSGRLYASTERGGAMFCVL